MISLHGSQHDEILLPNRYLFEITIHPHVDDQFLSCIVHITIAEYSYPFTAKLVKPHGCCMLQLISISEI